VVGNLEWEKAPNPKKQHAFAFTDCRVKGWRLPSRAELKSLYSSCSDTPGPLSLFPSCTCADGDPCKMLPQDKMWTGEYAGTYSGLYPDAWVVDAQNTRESYFMAMSAEHSYLSLCVRQTRSGSGE